MSWVMRIFCFKGEGCVGEISKKNAKETIDGVVQALRIGKGIVWDICRKCESCRFWGSAGFGILRPWVLPGEFLYAGTQAAAFD